MWSWSDGASEVSRGSSVRGGGVRQSNDFDRLGSGGVGGSLLDTRSVGDRAVESIGG